MIRQYYNSLPSIANINWNTPDTLAVELDYVENRLKSDLNVSDTDFITDLIKSATNASEKCTNRAYINRDIEVFYENVWNKFTLPVANFNSLVSLSKVDKQTGVVTAFTSDDYDIVTLSDYVTINLKSQGYISVKCVYNAGYGATYSAMPSWVREAVTARVAWSYSKPELMAVNSIRFTQIELTNMFVYYNNFKNSTFGNAFPTIY